jgi:glycine/D-amino acid oxidase-like deaminating enzyme
VCPGQRGRRQEEALSPAAAALAGARPVPYWLDQPGAPEPAPVLTGAATASLAVIGGGFTGLWTALLAKERNPATEVVLVEGRAAGWAASGRNGGFCAATLTHGLANGRARFPGEIAELDRVGMANLAEIEAAIARYGIDCGAERTGELVAATRGWQLPGLQADAAAARALGHDVRVLDAAEIRAELASPSYLGGIWHRDSCLLLDPARLARGLRRACLALGVRIFEHSPVTGLRDEGGAGLRLLTREGSVLARRVAVGTGAFPPLLRRLRHYLVPVYDYVLMTEPLSAAQLASIG